MPIRPENSDRYPKDWSAIRERILKRAENACEFCGAENYQPHPETGSKVVLTIAHLNHIIEDCSDENLRALCQKCHNGHDAKTRAIGKMRRRYEKLAAGDLFTDERRNHEQGN